MRPIDDFEEVPELSAGKRLGVQRCPWMGDWFTSWSPRNCNNNAEGQWSQWAQLAAMILSHPATKATMPHLYRDDFCKLESLYTDGPVLNEAQIAELFRKP